MTAPTAIVIICWTFFFVYWLISAAKVKPIAQRQTRLSALLHRVPLGLSYFLLVYPRVPPPLDLPLTPRSAITQTMAAIICVAGFFVTVWARRTLAGNWSSDVTFKQGHELIKAGPYRYVRHPIYTGLLVMCLGTAVLISHLRAWLALALMFTALWIKLRQEEKLLLRHFPDAYPAYQRETKALVPFVI